MVTRIDKALVAFIVAAAGALGSAQTAGDGITTASLIAALIVGLLAAVAVWATPNKPAGAPAAVASTPSPPA